MGFDRYFLQHVTISSSVRDALVEEQRERTPNVGDVAVQLGLLSPEGVADILAEQARRGMRFCETAIAMRRLTPLAAGLILREQRTGRPRIVDLALARGLISEVEAEELWRNFRTRFVVGSPATRAFAY